MVKYKVNGEKVKGRWFSKVKVLYWLMQSNNYHYKETWRADKQNSNIIQIIGTFCGLVFMSTLPLDICIKSYVYPVYWLQLIYLCNVREAYMERKETTLLIKE